MKKFMLAVYALDIQIIQVNTWNPRTGTMELRRLDTQDTQP